MLRRPDPQQWLLALGGRELVEAVRVAEQINAHYDRRYANSVRKPTRWHEPGMVRQSHRDANRFVLTCDSAWIEITLLAADAFHVRMRTLDDHFGVLTPMPAIPVQVQDDARRLTLQTERLVLTVDKARYRLRAALLPSKRVIYDESNGVSWSDLGDMRLSLHLTPHDVVWGTGALTQVVNLRGKRLRTWLLDGALAQKRELDTTFPPLLLGVRGSTIYGVHWHNTTRGWLDIGAFNPDELVFESEGGELAYTFAAGAETGHVAAQIGGTAQHPALPPLWAFGFGFGGTRMSSVERLPDMILEFQRRDVPCSVVYLDEHKSALPATQLAELVDQLHAAGVQVMAQFAPTVSIGDTTVPYVLQYPDHEAFVGASPSGAAFWLDFTHPDALSVWNARLSAAVQAGIDGVLLTHHPVTLLANGGKISAPQDYIQHHAGSHTELRSTTAQRAHNAAVETVTTTRPDRRPVVQARGIGEMMWLAAPTTWDGLRQVIPSTLNAAVSVPFVGVEIGAQTGDPDGELYTRWLQAACLMPLLRAWSPVRQALEPWAHGQAYQVINRITLKLRQRLMPYLYSLAALRREYGTPMIHPLFTLDLEDENLRSCDDTFLVGDILVAPVLTKGAVSREVYLPHGEWFDFWSHEALEGGQTIRVTAPLERLPLFVRGGAILPSQSEPNRLTLSVYPGERETILYEDSGEGFAALQGDYRWVYLTCARPDVSRLVIERRTAGRYQPTYRGINLEVMGLASEPTDVRLDRQGAPLWFFDDGVLELKLDDTLRRVEIVHPTDPADHTVPHRPLG